MTNVIQIQKKLISSRVQTFLLRVSSHRSVYSQDSEEACPKGACLREMTISPVALWCTSWCRCCLSGPTHQCWDLLALCRHVCGQCGLHHRLRPGDEGQDPGADPGRLQRNKGSVRSQETLYTPTTSSKFHSWSWWKRQTVGGLAYWWCLKNNMLHINFTSCHNSISQGNI